MIRQGPPYVRGALRDYQAGDKPRTLCLARDSGQRWVPNRDLNFLSPHARDGKPAKCHVHLHNATAFIQGYTQLMVEIHGPVSGKKAPKLLNVLAAARLEYLAKPALLDLAIRRLAAASVTIPDEVVSAIRALQVRKWVYLRDTRSHSVFIAPSGTVAYGVLGLTERIRDVIGGSGAMVETGLFRYGGRYVTDGIVSEAVWLGPQIKREYNDVLARLRSARAFHV